MPTGRPEVVPGRAAGARVFEAADRFIAAAEDVDTGGSAHRRRAVDTSFRRPRVGLVPPATRFEVIASPVTGDPFDDQVHSRDSMVVAASERADFGGAMSAGFLVVAQ